MDLIGIVRAGFRELAALVTTPPRRRRYLKAGPLHLWRRKRAFQIRFLREQGLQPSHRLLDIGCGPLRGGLPLIDYLDVGNYTGLEAREEVLEAARRELVEGGVEDKHATLIQASASADLELAGPFAFVWSYAVLIHMSDERLADCLACVARNLAPEGVFLANVGLGERRDAALGWQGFPVVWRPLAFYREQAALNALTVEDLGTIRSLGDVSDVSVIDDQHMLRFRRSDHTP